MTNKLNHSPDCPKPLTYSVKDAARVSGLGRTTLYAMRAAGTLPMIKISGRTLIRALDLEAALQIGPTPSRDAENEGF